jgi:starch phosphorylase
MLSPDQARIRCFEVVPSLPKPLAPLLDIAYNLWWSWHPEAVALFIRLDRRLWQETNHNPVRMLGAMSQQRLDKFARDEGFLTSLSRVESNFKNNQERAPWLNSTDHNPGDWTIGYFCAEYGLTECLQIYSGGLGCLAGDHLKSSAELGLPMVAVGLLYRHGYFQQYLNADGWQQEYAPDLDFANLMTQPVKGDDGQQVKIIIDMAGHQMHVALWQLKVGRVTLYLLDTNLPENDPTNQTITGALYSGDMDMRIRQEIVLGIGGVRALEAIGIRPDVCHMNEGHSAFMALERITRLIEQHDVSFDEARYQAAASHVFTTHTPVPAGIDRFPADMIKRYFKHYCAGLRLDMEGLLALGREDVTNKEEFFSMAVLAIRTSNWANGVSGLHGKVSRSMWRNIWHEVPHDEVPITHVTNGVHARSWLSGDLMNLLDRYLGARWQDDPADHKVWAYVHDVPDEELWRVHERRRQRLIVWAKRQLKKQLQMRGASDEHVLTTCDALNPTALTVGFARRFATYKRGTLFMRDADRLMKLLTNVQQPIQFLVAGKSHPADGGGKDLIRQIVQFARESEAGHKIVFLENYDIHVARYLVQGCDLWLNTPRRGMEASGTSGMKAAINGVLNCSIRDGWWDEAFAAELGWAIGRGEEYVNPEIADDLESKSFYDLLENEIIPMFYDRDDRDVPRQWVGRMKQSIAELAPVFNTNRMVQQYTAKLYLPALQRARVLAEDGLKKSIEMAHQIHRLRSHWEQISVREVYAPTDRTLGVHENLDLAVSIQLGGLEPEEVRVQVYSGVVDNDGQLIDGHAVDLVHTKGLGHGCHRFTGAIEAQNSGRHGFAIRVVPGGETLQGTTVPGLILWEGAKPKKKAKEAPVEKVA